MRVDVEPVNKYCIFVFCGLMSLCSFGCGISSRGGFETKGKGIINGTVVNADDPINLSLVKISDPSLAGDQRVCSGTLLAPNVVLAAAHCFYLNSVGGTADEDYEMRDVDQLIISTYVDGLEFESSISDYRSYSLPSRGFEGDDMALVLLSDSVPRGMKPLSIVDSAGSLKKEDEVIIAGYGKYSLGAQAETAELRKGTMKVENAEFTSKLVELISSQGSKQTTCYGDSGSPGLIIKDGHLAIWGVLRGGSAFCGPKSYFTKAFLYNDWIQSTLMQWNPRKVKVDQT